ncbi:IPT/TIG domain-containing protein [Streptomyces albireticuli]|nr:IPT/TIG domain-containing protein [Streptomyces albireticuli]MCD9140760.1 IPT/TIG domain-containing protein [Streptomyces albireticuli]MCD9161278.1 IPT/TIG domain-containing protein [Streptomyces albireticuli]MCD9190664.1 IPT/TIG domain-containing protein [Streptomyces albireticuli]
MRIRLAASCATAALALFALVTAPSATAAPTDPTDLSVSQAGNYPTESNRDGSFSVTWRSEGAQDITGLTRLTVELPPGITTQGALMYSTPYDYTFTETVSPDGRRLTAWYYGTMVPGRSHFMKVKVTAAGTGKPSGEIRATVANVSDLDTRNNVSTVTLGGSGGSPAIPPEPVVTGMDTRTGPGTGGTVVTITGRNLDDGFVDFGHDKATGSCTSTGCVVTTPPGWGVTPVDVATPGGGASAGDFTYGEPEPTPPPEPELSRLSTRGGPAAGGTGLQVAGKHLDRGVLMVGGKPAAHSSCGPEFCTGQSPAGTGTVDVTVDAPGGESAPGPSLTFTYDPAPGPTPAH